MIVSGVEIPAWCESYVGLPYLAGGRTRAGIDCWGLFNLIWAEHFKRPLPDYDGLHWQPGASAREVAMGAQAYSDRFRKIQPGQEQCGDGIMFRMRGVPLHLALVVTPGFMLHVEDGSDACIENYRSFQWEKRIIAFYRYE